MIRYQKPSVIAIEAASVAIQGQGKLTPIVNDAEARPSSGLGYDLDE
jgi:hypothetical protein